MLASGTIAKTLTSLKNQAESLASGRRHIAVLSHCLVWEQKLYGIQILCRRHPFWSYPTGLTIADPPG